MNFISKLKNKLFGAKDELDLLKELIEDLESKKEKIQFQLSENVRQVRNSLSELEDKTAREKELEIKAKDFLNKNDEESAVIALKRLKQTVDIVEKLHENVSELDKEKASLKNAFLEIENKIDELSKMLQNLKKEKSRSMDREKIATIISEFSSDSSYLQAIDKAAIEQKRLETFSKGQLKAEIALSSSNTYSDPEVDDFVKKKLENLRQS